MFAPMRPSPTIPICIRAKSSLGTRTSRAEGGAMTEDPKPQESREGDEPPSEGSGTTDDEGGAERAGLGRSEAEDKISK